MNRTLCKIQFLHNIDRSVQRSLYSDQLRNDCVHEPCRACCNIVFSSLSSSHLGGRVWDPPGALIPPVRHGQQFALVPERTGSPTRSRRSHRQQRPLPRRLHVRLCRAIQPDEPLRCWDCCLHCHHTYDQRWVVLRGIFDRWRFSIVQRSNYIGQFRINYLF